MNQTKTITAAWSESKETALTWSIRIYGAALVICCVSALVALVSQYELGLVISMIAGAIAAAAQRVDQDKLEKIQANRPYSGSQGLTRWHWHCHTTTTFGCPCGRQRTFEGAGWYPNHLDPNGGRYALVCACGRGHYKFQRGLE